MALVAFLKSGTLPAPTTVASPPAKDAGGAGFVSAGFKEGTLLLKNRAGKFYRLAWPREAAAKDRRRALPPGDYTLTEYRLVRRDDQGIEWFLSATGPAIRRLTVKAGEELPVPLDETAHVQCRVRRGGDGLNVQGVITGEHHAGMSIYRDGRRIALSYRVSDAQGKELAAGPMKYG